MSDNLSEKHEITYAQIDSAKFEEILRLALNYENATTLWLPGAGRTGLGYRLKNKIAFPKDYLEKAKNHLFIILDCALDTKILEEHLNVELEEYAEQRGIMKKISLLINKGKKIVFVIDNFTFNNLETLKYILSLRQISMTDIKYIFLGLESLFNAKRQTSSDISIVFHNFIKVPYLDINDSFQWLDLCSGILQVPLNQEVKQKLYEYCGGIIGLLKNAVRAYKRYGDIEQALVSEELLSSSKNIWQQFSKEEQYVLKNLFISRKYQATSKEFIYLKEHKLIADDNKVNGSWIKALIGIKDIVELRVKGGVISYMGVDLDEILTPREKKVILTLSSQKSYSADRELLGKSIWDNEYSSKYSDWAIDQIFSRLRRKLIKIGMPGDIIKTLKGRGFKLQNVKIIS